MLFRLQTMSYLNFWLCMKIAPVEEKSIVKWPSINPSLDIANVLPEL